MLARTAMRLEGGAGIGPAISQCAVGVLAFKHLPPICAARRD